MARKSSVDVNRRGFLGSIAAASTGAVAAAVPGAQAADPVTGNVFLRSPFHPHVEGNTPGVRMLSRRAR